MTDDLELVRLGLHRLQRLLGSRRTWVALAEAAHVDLSQQGIQILEVLHDGQARSVGELSGLARMDQGAVSRQVRALEAGGLARRRTSSAHGRVALVEASDEGLQAALRLHQYRHQHLVDALSSWEASDRETLGRLIVRLVDDLQATPYEPGVAAER